MAQLVRALLQRQLLHLLSLQIPTTTAITTTAITTTHRLSQRRYAQLQPRALRPPRELYLSKDGRKNNIVVGSDEDDKLNKRRTRNEMKREARQSVRWAMDLASFTTPQIKRILKAASLEEEVFEALMLVKRLGSDVREGKRRQFNYIGKLLRDADAQPDLLGALIQATKDGDQSRFQALAGSEKWVDEDPKEEMHLSESEEEHEDSGDHVTLASKWIDGLIEKDIQTSNEVYSLDSVDFDRQELRKLVRKVHSLQDCQNSAEDLDKGAKLTAAKKSLNRFLCLLARRHLEANS
ncbi:hypothetical protein RDABS01_011353 [Bienertia sinuspersici]